MNNPSMKKYLLIPVLLLHCFTSLLQAQNGSIQSIISSPPSPAKLVNDFAGILTADQKAALENKLVAFDKATSTQITVVLVNTLDGMNIADAATELGRNWGVGQQKNNNGVVLLVAKTDRKLNISPGYGLEKVLPDITCQQIIDQVIKPRFRGEDYYRGLEEGTDAIMQASRGEFTAPPGYYKGGKGLSAGKVLLMIIVIVILLSIISRGGGGGSFMSRRGYRGFNGPVIFPGGWGGGGSGGGGWSGGGGGGFGGFGGGSFGGGGASGDW
jgi:uncharacterized protein